MIANQSGNEKEQPKQPTSPLGVFSCLSLSLFSHALHNDKPEPEKAGWPLRRRRRRLLTMRTTSSSPPLHLLGGAATTLLFFLLLSATTTTHGFFAPPTHHHHVIQPTTTTTTTTTTKLHLSKRINHKIDLDSPKVATMEKYDANNEDNKKKKAVYCRCWKSETFPLCDGSHMRHNQECGDNVGPLIVTVDTATATATKATEDVEEDDGEKKDAVVLSETSSSPSPLHKLKSIFQKKDKQTDQGPTTKEKLAKMGLSALLSYGFVSNMSYAITLSLSWYTHSKKTGLSPLAPNQWKPFLAVYAGFYVFTNIIRPLRFGLSVVVSRYFDQFVNFIERKSGWGRKVSVGVVVFLANVCGTFVAMGLGVSLASGLAGVPIFPPK